MVEVHIAGVDDGAPEVERPVTALLPVVELHVAQIELARAVEFGLRGEGPALQTGDGHHQLEDGAGWVLSLEGAVLQGVAGVGGDPPPLLAREALREEVGVEGGPADHRQDLAGRGIHGDDGPLLPDEGRLGRLLDLPVDGEKHVRAGLGLVAVHQPEGATTGIHFDLLTPVHTADEGVEAPLNTGLAQGLAGAEVPILLALELGLIHLAHVAEQAGRRPPAGIGAHRADAQVDAGEIDTPLFHGYHHGLVQVLAEEERLIGPGPALRQAGLDLRGRDLQDARQNPRHLRRVGHILGNGIEVEGGSVLHHRLAVAVEDETPRGLDHPESQAVVGGEGEVVVPFQDLEVPEAKQEDQAADADADHRPAEAERQGLDGARGRSAESHVVRARATRTQGSRRSRKPTTAV